MNNNLIASVSPHIRSNNTTATIMRDVIIALLPAVVASVVIFGPKALFVEVFSVVCAVFFEWGFEKICNRPITICDYSAALTGLLLALNCNVDIPLWQLAFGNLVAIIMVKQLFGGIGKNFANPAITARVIMLIAFSGTMTTWTLPRMFQTADAVTGPTPLTMIAKGITEGFPTTQQMFLGLHGGCLGETCALALLIGFVYLLVRKVITWHTPVAFVGTVFILCAIIPGVDPVTEILAGGLFLGAIFMATDYATTPSTNSGRIIFGIGCGLITVLIRVWGNYPEGVSFSILLMNLLTPYISKWTRTKPLGGVQ